ncbi:RidA family protein [Marinibacterium profundimaris]|uniref:Endoribonuclease L-PSP n=1 Tax=Marinibacterium profundimaris TaxID=1679460 RepID=A0A225NLW9_9RHOB|nr:RidA family protein [Marinibacterium profundimaris]OWU73458.1 endoribonuclease L-PSP [Marinibacterium profundimaris]
MTSVPNLPFSKTRRVDNLLFLSGELGFDAEGKIPDGIEAQTRNCLERIGKTLACEGVGLQDVVSCTCYLTDKADFAAFNAVYAEYFSDPLPVRTTVLSGLMLDACVEITVIAKV